MHKVQQHHLPPEVGFDVKSSGRVIKMFNAVCIYKGDQVTCVLNNPDLEYARGKEEGQAIARSSPYLGGNGWSWGQVRAYCRQRLATHRQILRPHETNEWAATAAADRDMILEVLHLGYPEPWLEKVLEGLPPAKNFGQHVKFDRSYTRGENRRGIQVRAPILARARRRTEQRRGPGSHRRATYYRSRHCHCD